MPTIEIQLSTFDHKLHMSTFVPTKHYNISARIHHSRYYGKGIQDDKKRITHVSVWIVELFSCRSSSEIPIDIVSLKTISRVLIMKVKVTDIVVLYYLIVPDKYNSNQIRDIDVAKYGTMVGKCGNEIVTIATTEYFEYSWNVVYFAISVNGCVTRMIKRRFLPCCCLLSIRVHGIEI